LKRKKREGKSNTLSTDILIKEIIETKLIEMVNSVEEKFKCGPPHPPPEQRTNEQVAPVTVLVPAAVSPRQSKEESSLLALDAFLQRVYPRHFTAVASALPWSRDHQLERTDRKNWRERLKLILLNKFMQVVSNNNPQHCTFLLKSFVNSNTKIRELMKEKENEKDEVVKSIKSFVTKLSDGGCKKKEDKEALTVILTACTDQLQKSTNLNKVRNAIGMSKKSFYGSKKVLMNSNQPDQSVYQHNVRVRKELLRTKAMQECIREFCHSDESSRIDSNSHRIVDVKGEDGKTSKHVGRVWSALTINDQYKLFLNSNTVQTYQFIYSEHEFKIPSRSFFHANKCPCVKLPSTQSCVDITVSTVQQYMRALSNFLMANRTFKRRLYGCDCGHHDWEKLLGGTVEQMVDATCCPRTKKEHLCVGVGTTKRDPSFLDWKCANGTCNNCGVEAKLGVRKCPIWNDCALEMNVLEWVHAIRQGISNGKQNTQLEVQNRRYKVPEVLKKFVDALDKCRAHQASYEWKNWMRKLDMEMGDADMHRVICTDFGATLDLSAAEKDNCSVDNHAVLAIYFVLSNWRTVKYKKEDSEYDETIICDCDKWLFFGDTISKGKKNDHIFSQ